MTVQCPLSQNQQNQDQWTSFIVMHYAIETQSSLYIDFELTQVSQGVTLSDQ